MRKALFMRLKVLLGILLLLSITAILVFFLEQKSDSKEPNIVTSSKNAITPLALPNAYGDTQATHPKVIAFETPWNGYTFWMSFTPYCNGRDDTENPHILASNNLSLWEEPIGYSNPLEPTPDNYCAYVCYNSDSHLLYNDELKQLECWWRYVDGASDQVIIYRKKTTDGVHWSEKEILMESKWSEDDYLSLSVIYENGIYKIWTIGHGDNFRYWESIDGNNWQHIWEHPIQYSNKNLRSWHIDVIHTEKGGYESVIVAYDSTITRDSHLEMSLYYTQSDDNYNYSQAELLLNPTIGSKRWDNRGLYRSSLLYNNGIYYLFYSGIQLSSERHIGMIQGPDIFNMQ